MRGVCQVSSLCLVSALAAIAGLREAEAACNITQPTSGQTVVCDTAPPNPTFTVISASAGSTNVTVTLLTVAILVTGVRAIAVLHNRTVPHRGHISPSP